MGMWLVAGLGNPGREYESSRHNVGFMVVDALARRHRAPSSSSKFNGEVSTCSIGGESVLLLKPTTFMNRSGESVQPAAAFYKIGIENVIVVHDDMDLELGQIKLKRGGSSGGHNGIKSIDAHVGPEYLRVRGGVGHARHEGRSVVGHVLGSFGKADADAARALVDACADAVEALIAGSLEK